MRVVSLLPAATEIVAALGAGDQLVGVSHECDHPAAVVAGLPPVTRSTIDPTQPSGAIDRQTGAAHRAGVSPVTVDSALLAQLAPDLVVGQSVCDVCAVGASQLAAAIAGLPAAPAVVSLHAHRLDDVFADIARVGQALDLAERGLGLADRLRGDIEGLRVRVRKSPRPRVVVLEWLDPPYVAGHWVPELVTAAGGTDAAGVPGARSTTRTWPELRDLAPDLVIVALCGFDIPRARREVAAVADRLATLGPVRLAYLDGNAYTSRAGPRLVEGAEQMARLIAG